MISERLEKLVEDMVDKGVHFEDAVHEFEKRFISRVLGCCDGSLTKTAEALGHAPQHAHPQDGRVPDQAEGRIGREGRRRPRHLASPTRAVRPIPPYCHELALPR